MSTDNARVLNAASDQTLQRTIIEAFVKLVVCRKITVQTVSMCSGQILDSHTTQEEDVPVILNVHHHETGNLDMPKDSHYIASSITASDHHMQKPRTSSTATLNRYYEQCSSHKKDKKCGSNQDLNSTSENTVSLNVHIPTDVSELSVHKRPNHLPEKISPLHTSHLSSVRTSHLSSGLERKRIKIATNDETTTETTSSPNAHVTADNVCLVSSRDCLATVEQEDWNKTGHESAGKGYLEDETEIHGDEHSTQQKQLAEENSIFTQESYQSDELADMLGSENDTEGQTAEVDKNILTEKMLKTSETIEMEGNSCNKDVLDNNSDNSGLKDCSNHEYVNETSDISCEENQLISAIQSPEAVMSATDETYFCISKSDWDKEDQKSNIEFTKEQNKMSESCTEEHQVIIIPDKENVTNSNLTKTTTIESSVTSSAVTHDAAPVNEIMPPDPFAHLLDGFLPPKRTFDNAFADGSNESRTSCAKTGKMPSKPHVVSIKEELDDDCMITAAFITTSEPRQVASQASRKKSSAGKSVIWGGKKNEMDSQYRSVSWSSRQRAFSEQGRGMPATTYQVTSSTSVQYPPNFLSSRISQHSTMMPADAVTGDYSHANQMPSSSPGSSAEVDYSQETYQCPLCSKIFLHRYKFDMHTAMCGGQRPFKCRLCGKAFNQRAHLDTHMKFHQGIKPYRCDICHKAYVMKGDLIRHLKTRLHHEMLSQHGAASSSIEPHELGVPFQDQALDHHTN